MSHSTVSAEGNFLIPDGTFIAELAAFILIAAFIYKVVVPPLKASMDKRQDIIRQQLEDSRLAAERLEAAEADYAAMMAEARAEAARQREDGFRVRAETIEAAKAEARQAAEAVTRQAEERLAVEHRQALNQLKLEVGQLATELASRIVGESLSDQALQQRVIDRFLDELNTASPVAQDQAR
jgi:F-type H+-transporting ATPase subunit b